MDLETILPTRLHCIFCKSLSLYLFNYIYYFKFTSKIEILIGLINITWVSSDTKMELTVVKPQCYATMVEEMTEIDCRIGDESV